MIYTGKVTNYEDDDRAPRVKLEDLTALSEHGEEECITCCDEVTQNDSEEDVENNVEEEHQCFSVRNEFKWLGAPLSKTETALRKEWCETWECMTAIARGGDVINTAPCSACKLFDFYHFKQKTRKKVNNKSQRKPSQEQEQIEASSKEDSQPSDSIHVASDDDDCIEFDSGKKSGRSSFDISINAPQTCSNVLMMATADSLNNIMDATLPDKFKNMPYK